MKAEKTTRPTEKQAEVTGGSQNKKYTWFKTRASLTVRDACGHSAAGCRSQRPAGKTMGVWPSTLVSGGEGGQLPTLLSFLSGCAHLPVRGTASKTSNGLSLTP